MNPPSPDTAARKAIGNHLSVVRADSPTFQISTRVRQMILDAKLQPGMRLPTNIALAAELGVDASAVQRALNQLVKEGLLVRTRRVGTFVAEPSTKKLERLAFYHRAEHGQSVGEFDRTLLTEITSLGHSEGFAVEVFIDTRKIEESDKGPPADLLRQARTRRVQGIVTPAVSPNVAKWLPGLPVPIASLSDPLYPYGLNWDRREMGAGAVRQLVSRGCRKIGMISATLAREDPEADKYQLGIWRGLTDALAEAKLELHPGRMAGLGNLRSPLSQQEMPQFGFSSFNKLWTSLAKDARPDGLFIYPDTMAVGAITALAGHGLRVPEDLRLVLHTNAECPVFCPYPADRLVVSTADAAQALVDHVRNQLIGRTTPKRPLPFQIKRHNKALNSSRT